MFYSPFFSLSKSQAICISTDFFAFYIALVFKKILLKLEKQLYIYQILLCLDESY